MDVSGVQTSGKVSGSKIIEESYKGVKNSAFLIPRIESSADCSLPQGIQSVEEVDFDMLRIFNRYHQRYVPDCDVCVGEESIPFDSRVLSKLSCFLAGAVGAAKNSGTERPKITLSDISPEALRLFASFLSGEKDLPNLLNEHELALFTELVAFACRWRCVSLLTYFDKHAVRCLNQNRGVSGSILSSVSLLKALVRIPVVKNVVPRAFRRFITENQDLVTAESLKLAYWTKKHPEKFSELLKKLPEFQQTVCAHATNVTPTLLGREITIVPESLSLWPILNPEHSLSDESALFSIGCCSAEQQRQKVGEYLKCVESWQLNGFIPSDLEGKKEDFLIGLLLHVVSYSSIKQDFAPFSCDLFCYLRDRFIRGDLSKESARLILKLAEQNPTYLSLLREKKLTLHAQETHFVDLLAYIETVAVPEQPGLWSKELLNKRLRAAQKWSSNEWERVALPNLWQLFHAMLNQDEVSYAAISTCYSYLKERCAEEAHKEEPAQWVVEANTLLNRIQGQLQWLGEIKQLHRQIEVVTEVIPVEVSLFHLTLNEYISGLQWNTILLGHDNQPTSINWQSQNVAQLEVLQHVLECGELPDTVPLSEVDWDSLIHDLAFLGYYEPAEKLESALYKKVTFTNVVEYWLFARQFALEGLTQHCIKTINASGVISLTPGPDGSYELKELTAFDQLSTEQKEVVMQLPSEHYSTIKIKTWRGQPKLSRASQVKSVLQAKLVKGISTFAKISFASTGAYIGWQSRVDGLERLGLRLSFLASTPFTESLVVRINEIGYTLFTESLVLRINEIGTNFFTSLSDFMVDAALTGSLIVGGAIAGTMAYHGLRKGVTRIFRREPPLAHRAPLRIRGPEIDQLPLVAAPADAEQLAHILDENVRTLDLSLCSSQLTANDIKWIAQCCPHLTELSLGVTNGLFGNDWLPLAKLNCLRKIVIVLEGSSQTDLSSINSFNLKEFVPSWPVLEEVHVTIEKWIPVGKLQFFENCPNKIPLTVRFEGFFSSLLANKLPMSLRVLEGSERDPVLVSNRQRASTLATRCPFLKELRNIVLDGEDLEILAKGCDLERLVNCRITAFTNEHIQRLVYLRGEKLKEFTIFGISDLTAVGLNAFAACKNLERLMIMNAMVENDEAIQPLLNAQIPFLSLPMVTGVSLNTRWQLANRWFKNMETMCTEELRLLMSSAVSGANSSLWNLGSLGMLALLGSKGKRSLATAVAKKTWDVDRLEDLLGFRLHDEKLVPSQVPASALLFGLELLRSRSFVLDLTQEGAKEGMVRSLFAIGCDPVVGLRCILNLVDNGSTNAYYQEYLRLFSVGDYGISESDLTQLLQRCKEVLKNENGLYAGDIREELGRVLFANEEQLMIWAQQIATGPEQTLLLLSQLFPMTWQYLKNVQRRCWQGVHQAQNIGLQKNMRRIRDLKEKRDAAQRNLEEMQNVVEGLRNRREARLADPRYRGEYGELLARHVEAQRAEEQMITEPTRKIALYTSQIEELESTIEEPNEEAVMALFIGALLHPEGGLSVLRDTLLELTDPTQAPR